MIYNERSSDRKCPKCGSACTQYDWWDDPPELGGGFLEVIYDCTMCDWSTD